MGKRTTTLLLEDDLVQLAKARKINVSAVCNESLKSILGIANNSTELEQKKATLENELRVLARNIEEVNSFKVQEADKEKKLKEALVILKNNPSNQAWVYWSTSTGIPIADLKKRVEGVTNEYKGNV